jgi:hypothetical protein
VRAEVPCWTGCTAAHYVGHYVSSVYLFIFFNPMWTVLVHQPRFGCEKPATVNSLSCSTALGSSKCGSAGSGLVTSQLLEPQAC